MARDSGYDCWGLEPGEQIGDDGYTIRGYLNTADLRGQWDWMTLHDSIEHMPDPRAALGICREHLCDWGKLIIDLPDFWTEQGRHHWKQIEHLWFWTAPQFEALLATEGFRVEEIKKPIPGKLVFYVVKL
jgi:hypothetical protein